MRSHVPPDHTIHEPPYHFHASQSESFRLVSGVFFATVDGVVHELNEPGRAITVRAGKYHKFINPDPCRWLVVDIGLDPPSGRLLGGPDIGRGGGE